MFYTAYAFPNVFIPLFSVVIISKFGLRVSMNAFACLIAIG